MRGRYVDFFETWEKSLVKILSLDFKLEKGEKEDVRSE